MNFQEPFNSVTAKELDLWILLTGKIHFGLAAQDGSKGISGNMLVRTSVFHRLWVVDQEAALYQVVVQISAEIFSIEVLETGNTVLQF